MPLVIKHQNSDSLGGNLRIIVEPFLEMAADRLFLSVTAVLKILESQFGELCFIKNKKLDLEKSTFLSHMFLSNSCRVLDLYIFLMLTRSIILYYKIFF